MTTAVRTNLDPPLADSPSRLRLRGEGLVWTATVAAIAALAFLIRLGFLLRGGGLLGTGGYDDGVYYGAADALVHGLLPYRDFLFIEPPTILVAIAPFAWWGTLSGDQGGFELARVAFMVVGGLNAGLIAVLARRFGRIAGVVGGVCYAIFFPAAYSERSTLLEPLATTLILLSLLILRRSWSPPWVGAVLAGAVGGAAIGFKIWYIVPLAVIVAFQPRRRLLFLAGVVVAGLLVYLPFFVTAPARMWRQVVQDQLGRPGPTSFLFALKQRLIGISGAPTLHGVLAPLTPTWIAGVVLLGVLVLGIAASTVEGAQVYPALTLAALAVLLASPSYFTHYVALIAPPAAVTVGIGTARLVAFLPRAPARIAAAVALIGVVALINLDRDTEPIGARVPIAALGPATTAVSGCVTTDDPTLLASLDVLSRDLSRRCRFWPDVTGYTYDRDGVTADGRELPRAQNLRWQRDVVAYLRSGDALILNRPATGLSAASRAVLQRGRVVARAQGYVLRATP